MTGNWVHHNKAVGLFADTNNVKFQIEGNLIEENYAEGIVYETSYNARIANNTLRRNGIVKGLAFAARGDNFPVPAIYVSESGGDSRVNNGIYSTLEVTGNTFVDNWGGVISWENADRFCGSDADTSTGFCTLGGAATPANCAPGTINSAPYYSDCRWKTQNVSVHDNELSLNRAAIGCGPTATCGQHGLLSSFGIISPHTGTTVQDAITYTQNNHFADNRYIGDWRFVAHGPGNFQTLAEFQAAPFVQDVGSTQIGATPQVALDEATATLEPSIGRWVPWFSAGVSRSDGQAHTGTRSLKVDVTAPHGWGVETTGYPGFATTPGDKTVSYWAMAGSAAGLAVDMKVTWRNASNADLRTDTLTMTGIGPVWAQAATLLTAPAGTRFVGISLSNSTGVANDALFFDDFSLAEPGPPPPPTGGWLDADTANLEGGIGRWVPWFSAGVSRSDGRPTPAPGASRSTSPLLTAGGSRPPATPVSPPPPATRPSATGPRRHRGPGSRRPSPSSGVALPAPTYRPTPSPSRPSVRHGRRT